MSINAYHLQLVEFPFIATLLHWRGIPSGRFSGFQVRSFGEEAACNSGMIVLGLSKRRCGRDRRETQSTKYMGHTGNTTGIQLILPPILGLSGILVGIECDNSLTV